MISDAQNSGCRSFEETQTWAEPSAGVNQPLSLVDSGTTDRYEDIGLIGAGGMGEVRRVWDRVLSRTMAMKLIRTGRAQSDSFVLRFRAEAMLLSRLQHPAVVAIHDFGLLRQRLFFTMPEIKGDTLAVLIEQSRPQGGELIKQPTLRRLLGVLKRAGEGVAYAHSQDILHRDLKPDNVMTGCFGEVFVLDWGIAKLRELVEMACELEPTLPCTATKTGKVQGTLVYMAPEQARGEADLTPAADVYALGAILFEILSGMPLRIGPVEHCMSLARTGWRPALPRREQLPAELVDLCESALDPDPARRPADASAFTQRLSAWLEGARNLEQAQALIARADDLGEQLSADRERAAVLRAEAVSALEAVSPTAPESLKWAGWELEDKARALEAALLLKQTQHEQLLREALVLVPRLPGADRRLAALYRARHQRAEQDGEVAEASRLEFLLRRHDHGEHQRYLSGEGELMFQTQRPVHATLHRFVLQRRRLKPERLRRVSAAQPILLPAGSYLVEMVDCETGQEVRYPVVIERGVSSQHAVHIPLPSELASDTCYVAAGSFDSGGDSLAYGDPLPARRVSLGGFAIQRLPVTNAQWLLFLNSLVAAGCEDEALEHVPRTRSRTPGVQGDMVYGRDAAGLFCLVPDRDGDLWLPLWPVVMVTVPSIQAYARWLQEQTGFAWQMPTELQWEKAARGVDRRLYPWGNFFDPGWCHMTESHGTRQRGPGEVGSWPIDTSVYGVQDLAGNVLDICADNHSRDLSAPAAGLRTARGGNWAAARGKSRICYRGPVSEDIRSGFAGFRLVHPVGRL